MSVIALDGAGADYESGPFWRRRKLTAVGAVDLAITAGETLGLVGESGSGKTTVGRLALGIVRPSRGRVLFDGAALPRRSRGRLAVVLQNPDWALNPRLKLRVSVAEPLAIEGRPAPVAELLTAVGLDPSLAGRYPHALSGGQRQRAAIARALSTSPRFILFDEAVSALDASVQMQILNLIRQTQAQTGFAALFIAHDLAATRYVAHRIAVMYAGEVVEVAPREVFYGRAQHPYSRALQQTLALGAIAEPAATGCRLHNRCPYAEARCRVDPPALRAVGLGLVACHRAEEIADA